MLFAPWTSSDFFLFLSYYCLLLLLFFSPGVVLLLYQLGWGCCTYVFVPWNSGCWILIIIKFVTFVGQVAEERAFFGCWGKKIRIFFVTKRLEANCLFSILCCFRDSYNCHSHSLSLSDNRKFVLFSLLFRYHCVSNLTDHSRSLSCFLPLLCT